MALTKEDLVKALVKENVFQKMRSIEIVETMLEIIKSKLASGEDVLISGCSAPGSPDTRLLFTRPVVKGPRTRLAEPAEG